MGRMLGSFADDNELDRPDLNKCPDCDCFFASDTCPLCKKVCPEEMRAGNRKPVKHKKQRRSSGSGRIYFIQWYHRWWFIILMIWAIPIAGIVLLVSSPHEKWKKWLVAGIYVAWLLLSTFGFTIASYLGGLFDKCLAHGFECVYMTPNMLNTYRHENTATQYWEYAKKTSRDARICKPSSTTVRMPSMKTILSKRS